MAADLTGEHWLDLGCGGGAISRAVWLRTQGAVGSVVGLDCAAANDAAYARHRTDLGVEHADRFYGSHFETPRHFRQVAMAAECPCAIA